MSIIAVWCRHKDDNIIGIGEKIPWYIPSDLQRFKRITIEKNIVVGRKTYESFPNRTLPKRKMFILTKDVTYEPSDANNHYTVKDMKKLKSVEDDLYIAGGASIYAKFLSKAQFMPDVIVDSVFLGDLEDLDGKTVDISASVEIMEKKYFKLSDTYIEDNVETSIWIKKSDFVDQNLVKNIIATIENK